MSGHYTQPPNDRVRLYGAQVPNTFDADDNDGSDPVAYFRRPRFDIEFPNTLGADDIVGAHPDDVWYAGSMADQVEAQQRLETEQRKRIDEGILPKELAPPQLRRQPSSGKYRDALVAPPSLGSFMLPQLIPPPVQIPPSVRQYGDVLSPAQAAHVLRDCYETNAAQAMSCELPPPKRAVTKKSKN